LGVGIGSVAAFGSPWGWGYYNYYNPYWAGPVGGVTYINYSQPIVTPPPAQGPAPGPTSSNEENALAIFETARAFFKRGDYSLALTQANRAVALLPNDSLMHEFRALCLFAMQDYRPAAAALYAVLSVGPGWDMATVSGLYGSPNVYAGQLRTLENYRAAHPQAAEAHFLLAYHYMLGGHNDQAAAELRAVVELEPKDQLAAQLLKGLTSPPAEQAASLPAPAPLPSVPVDAESVVGNWRATRPDGSKFALNLTADHKFSWQFDQEDKQQQLSGTYTLADNYLILSAADQNALVGQVAMEPGDKLKFKLAGGSPSDPGLTFTR
jgi:tetratricopeptide (TPR) repeat protein